MQSYEFGLYVFMLAAFLGFELVKRVSPLLHTPLMSLTNALDAIAVVGAILLAGEYHAHGAALAKVLGTIAIVAATSSGSLRTAHGAAVSAANPASASTRPRTAGSSAGPPCSRLSAIAT